MNKMARKLVLSILTVVLTVVALGTTTFAWFTLTNQAVVQPFSANVISETGIEIALADYNVPAEDLVWVTSLTALRIQDYIQLKYGPDFRFDAVTSVDGRSFIAFALPGDTPANAGSGWLTLNLHFRSATTQSINWSNVTLTGATSPTLPIGTPFTNSKGVSIIQGGTYDVNPADAFRISVTGLVSGAQNTIVYENGISDTNTVLSGLSNADLTGANGALDFYFQSTSLYPGGTTGVTTVPTITALSNNRVLDMSIEADAIYDASYFVNQYYGRLTVRIWFEGWDAEAFNVLLSRPVTASFRFVGI
jgi:hypothetical protein